MCFPCEGVDSWPWMGVNDTVWDFDKEEVEGLEKLSLFKIKRVDDSMDEGREDGIYLT